MKTKILNISALFVIIISLWSCSDSFLNEDTKSEINSNSFYKTESDMILLANSLYAVISMNQLEFTNYAGGLFFNDYWIIQDIASDNCNESSFSNFHMQISNFTFDSNNEQFYNMWKDCYEVINIANTLIERIEYISDIKAGVKTQLLGEAHYFRGMLFFELVKMFGSVPIKITETKTLEDGYINKSSVKLVYKQIVEDLIYAKQNLKNNPFTDRIEGVPTSIGTSGLLSKVYLTKGALTGNKKDFENSVEFAQEVINSNKYSLWDNFADIFKIKNANQKEIIHAINFSGTLSEGFRTSQLLVRLLPALSGIDAPNNAHGWEIPTKKLLSSYDNADKRKAVTFISSFTHSDGFVEKVDPVAIQKYWDIKAEPKGNESDADFIYLRYADVLLIYAEAINEVNKAPNVLAYSAINKVRNRAGLNDLTSNLNYQDFKDAILQERQWEFVMEGQRWFDLVRHNKLKEKVELAKKNVIVKEFHKLFPIPQREVSLNENLKQNDGY